MQGDGKWLVLWNFTSNRLVAIVRLSESDKGRVCQRKGKSLCATVLTQAFVVGVVFVADKLWAFENVDRNTESKEKGSS